jgi:small subunit ribosomal protein S20
VANHPSALKAHRQSLARKRRNKSNRSQLRTALKKFSEQAKTGKTDQAAASIASLYSIVDKGVRKGVLSKNAAARQKSRLTRRLNRAATEAKKA